MKSKKNKSWKQNKQRGSLELDVVIPMIFLYKTEKWINGGVLLENYFNNQIWKLKKNPLTCIPHFLEIRSTTKNSTWIRRQTCRCKCTFKLVWKFNACLLGNS